MEETIMIKLLIAILTTSLFFMGACNEQSRANAVQSPQVQEGQFISENHLDPHFFMKTNRAKQPTIHYMEQISAVKRDRAAQVWYEQIQKSQEETLLVKRQQEITGTSLQKDPGIITYNENELKERLHSQEKLIQWLENRSSYLIPKQELSDEDFFQL